MDFASQMDPTCIKNKTEVKQEGEVNKKRTYDLK